MIENIAPFTTTAVLEMDTYTEYDTPTNSVKKMVIGIKQRSLRLYWGGNALYCVQL